MWPPTLLVMPMRSSGWLSGRVPGNARTCIPRSSIERLRSRRVLHDRVSTSRSTWIPLPDVWARHLTSSIRADAWDEIVEMRGGMKVPARLLPLARLLEVVIHHVDLDIGYEITDIDTQTAEWLLEWCAFRLRDRDDFPRLQLTSDTGFATTVGSAGEPIAVSGGSAHLLGWLMGRSDGSALTGAGGLQLPAY